MPRIAPLTIIATLAAAALFIAVSEYLNLRSVDQERPAKSLVRLQVTQPWGGLAAREGARYLETRWRLDAEASAAALWWQLHRYPMDPWRWLLMARVSRQVDERQGSMGAHMSTAVGIQPGSRELRWQSAQLAQTTGEVDLVIDHLRLWLRDQPHMADRALFVAGRWIDDTGELIDRLLPEGEAFLARAMRFARTSRNLELADALWQRLDHPRPPRERVVADYIFIQQSAGDPTTLMTIWQELDPHYRPGTVPAGHFGFSKEELPAFGWNLREPQGVTITPISLDPESRPPSPPRPTNQHHDFEQPKHQNTKTPKIELTSQPANKPTDQPLDEILHALKISFNGKENVNLGTPLIRFPVPEPGHYLLTGYWRAEGLTTRALPYIHVRSDNGATRERLDIPANNFEWTPFEIPIEITEANETVMFRLVRQSTEAFDRYIEGSVWVAGVGVR